MEKNDIDDELTFSQTLGLRIREIRKSRGLTQTELAKRCGVTRISINYIEAGGRVPHLETAVALCKALRCTMNHLIPMGACRRAISTDDER